MRTVLAAAVFTAALVAVPVTPASATIDKCPEGVAAVRGTDLSWDKTNMYLEASAATHDVPAAVLKAIALRESSWDHFLSDGRVKVSSDSVCGLGMMQITADGRSDAVRLAEDIPYNIDEGAKILREKWEVSQQTAPPADSAPDDDDVIENWYYALCLYNGCNGTDDTYARAVAGMVADPFRRVPWYLWTWMRPAGFTMPHEADPSYVFPSAFQARHTAQGGSFVFYDHTTGTVTKTVPARTHRASAPPVTSYPQRTTGPDHLSDGRRSTDCGVCGGWRLAEGAGVAGRAHWTNTVTSNPQTSISWRNSEQGLFRVSAYVPDLGDGVPLGKATYRVRPTGDETKHYAVPVDQNARKGTWVSLGTWDTPDGAMKVYLDDLGSVGGQRIVADAVRFTPVPELRIEAFTRPAPNHSETLGSIDYGRTHLLGVSFDLRPQYDMTSAGRPIKIYRRPAGTTAWQMLGTWPTNALGYVEISAKPLANTEYTARFTSPDAGATITDAASPTIRVTVRPLVRAALARSSVRSGETVVVNASVTPNHAGQLVYLQRFYSGAWRTVTTRTLSSTSTVSFPYRFTQPCCEVGAEHLFRVYKSPDRDHVAAFSPVMKLLMSN